MFTKLDLHFLFCIASAFCACCVTMIRDGLSGEETKYKKLVFVFRFYYNASLDLPEYYMYMIRYYMLV